MVKLQMLSKAIDASIDQVFQNQDLCKYIKYEETKDPLSQPNIADPIADLLFKHVFPFPFNPLTDGNEKIQLRIYSYRGRFTTRTVENNRIAFDILLPKVKNAWLVTGEKIRPLVMMEEIVNTLFEKDINIGGYIQFLDYDIINFTNDYSGYRLMSQLVNFTSGKK